MGSLGYPAAEGWEFGLGYRGTYIDVVEGRNGHTLLPPNQTYINSHFFSGHLPVLGRPLSDCKMHSSA